MSKKPPDKIYLQWYGSTLPMNDFDDAVTWCEDKINDDDVEYVMKENITYDPNAEYPMSVIEAIESSVEHLKLTDDEVWTRWISQPSLLEALENLENDDGSIPQHAWKMVCDAIASARGKHE